MINYKKIIKSRKVRLKILELLNFIPDELMVKLQYKIKTGYRLNLNNPKRYTEKLQWIKLYYRDPLMIRCVDKYDVREYIKEKGYESILNKCYGVFNDVNEIDFSILPKQFVLKDTLGGGGNSVIICKNKEEIDLENLKLEVQEWVDKSIKKNAGREWPYYSGKKHRIIIEELLKANSDEGGLIDYKFLCFNGEVECVYVLCDRILEEGAQCGIFDVNFNLLPYLENDEKPLKRKITKPKNYEKMLEIARNLSSDFPEARIDLYNQDGKISFGEITFFDSSGYMVFEPDEYDYILGAKFQLPNEN